MGAELDGSLGVVEEEAVERLEGVDGSLERVVVGGGGDESLEGDLFQGQQVEYQDRIDNHRSYFLERSPDKGG